MGGSRCSNAMSYLAHGLNFSSPLPSHGRRFCLVGVARGQLICMDYGLGYRAKYGLG